MSESRKGGIHAIILAAGPSLRFGERNKLLVEVDGLPILERVVGAVTGGGADETVVVTGADHESIASLLYGYDVKLVQNESWPEGMGTSLVKGVRALESENCKGILLCLGDLPFLSTQMVRRVIEVFRQHGCKRILLPKVKGRRGHPVIFPASYQPELLQLMGDAGARSIINSTGKYLTEVEVDSFEIIRDIDTQSDLPGKTC